MCIQFGKSALFPGSYGLIGDILYWLLWPESKGLKSAIVGTSGWHECDLPHNVPSMNTL